MMVQEFTERTKYEPTIEEYRYIEESYYDFNGNKDEFCKQWLKDKNSSRWETEYQLRKALAEQKKIYEAALQEKEENLQWYREQYEELQEYKNQVRGIKQIIGQ